MEWPGLFTLAVLAVTLVGLVGNLVRPHLLLAAAVGVLTLAGILSPLEALSGLANPVVATVGGLFVVAGALSHTGVLNVVGRRLIGSARDERTARARLAAAVLPASSFLNNTPIVAMLIPVVKDWAERHGVNVSRLLIPLSYLAILGGTCTLIGTSTNLVVHGMMIESGQRGMGLFEIGAVGLPMALAGMVYLLFFADRLLPGKPSVRTATADVRALGLIAPGVSRLLPSARMCLPRMATTNLPSARARGFRSPCSVCWWRC